AAPPRVGEHNITHGLGDAPNRLVKPGSEAEDSRVSEGGGPNQTGRLPSKRSNQGENLPFESLARMFGRSFGHET
ncbi:hypothetical protein ACFXG4_45690, partial [Nocardia sp. NPDC059246]|uniref:hypothetical protein n=1 Tax=Nocardia sp. NPDC059246 TaxID=3346789 RepID=UPI0036984C98